MYYINAFQTVIGSWPNCIPAGKEWTMSPFKNQKEGELEQVCEASASEVTEHTLYMQLPSKCSINHLFLAAFL